MTEPHGGSTSTRLRNSAERYTAAWCNKEPARVASFFATDGELSVNDGVLVSGLGPHTGTEGTGRRVRISGFEAWRVGAGRLIAEAQVVLVPVEFQRGGREVVSAQVEWISRRDLVWHGHLLIDVHEDGVPVR